MREWKIVPLLLVTSYYYQATSHAMKPENTCEYVGDSTGELHCNPKERFLVTEKSICGGLFLGNLSVSEDVLFQLDIQSLYAVQNLYSV